MSLYFDLIEQFGYNKTFLLKDISDENNYDSVKVQINKLVKKGLVRRYAKGIYFINNKIGANEYYPDVSEIIEKKYLINDEKIIGYFTGNTLLNRVGLNTNKFNVLEICTNVETNIKRHTRIDFQDIVLRKPLIKITNKNVRYLQFIDIFRYCDLVDLLENDKKGIKEFIKKNGLRQSELLKYFRYAPSKVEEYVLGSGIFEYLEP